MFRNLCLLLVSVLALGNTLRLQKMADFGPAFWLSVILCSTCFFFAFYHSYKLVLAERTKKEDLSALKSEPE